MVAFLTWLVLVLRYLLKTRVRLEGENLAAPAENLIQDDARVGVW